MANARAIKHYTTFVKGLFTEASKLNQPENTFVEGQNFVLQKDGTLKRRFGFDYESDYVLIDTGIAYVPDETSAITDYRWDNVGNNPNVSFVVVQYGLKLFFFDSSSNSISASYKGSITLSPKANGTNGSYPFDMSHGSGRLIVVSNDIEPYYIEYDNGIFTATPINIKVRDLWGVDDGLEVDERPGSDEWAEARVAAGLPLDPVLEEPHRYNLKNQGWAEETIVSPASDDVVKDPIQHTYDARGFYPSNADYILRDAELAYKPSLLESYTLGNTPAAKGHYIISAFYRGIDREARSGITGLPSDTESGRPSAVAFWQGRAFYSGIISSVTDGDSKSPNYTGYVFFSKTIENQEDFEKCYQEADPTSQDDPDIVDTDGGHFRIIDCGEIFKLIPFTSSLVVIADNGVWRIGTTDNGVFSPTNYLIHKVSSIGALNKYSIVSTNAGIFYFSANGIEALTVDQISGELVPQNISLTTIRSYYDSIPPLNLARAKGVWNPASDTIRWLFSTDPNYDGVYYKNKFNTELVLDIKLQAFYPIKINSLDVTVPPYIAGYITTPSHLTKQQVDNVLVNGEQVVVNGENVIVTSNVKSGTNQDIKYIILKQPNNDTTGNWQLTFGEFNNKSMNDWAAVDSVGIDTPAYIITGSETLGEPSRKKASKYIICYFNRTEDGFTYDASGNIVLTNQSSCYLQAIWDFANHSNWGKYSTKFQAYRFNRNYTPLNVSDPFNYGTDLIITKNKIRGNGRAISLRFESESGKQCEIVGWSIDYTGRANV